MRRFRSRLAWRAPAWSAILLLLVSADCAPGEGERASPAARAGDLGLFRATDGPLEEVRVRRDTAGGIVVSGFCFFPEETVLTVVVYDAAGLAVARTQPTVRHSLFRSLPLSPSGGAWRAGRYEVGIEVSFAPGAQPERVLREARNGEALSGDGMTRTRQGRPAFSKRFPIVVPASDA